MDQKELKDRLQKLGEDKLIDVVRNYRQYGYSVELREYAIQLLEERGISRSDLALSGKLENHDYNQASGLLRSFRNNSRLAFIFYILSLVLNVAVLRSFPDSMMLKVVLILCFCLYLYFLLQSFLNQSAFSKQTGDEYASDSAMVYLFLGMPFYVIMYFVFQSQMKEKLKLVS